MNGIFNWFVNLPIYIGNVGSFLTTRLDYINMSPLEMLGVGLGVFLAVMVAIHLVRLFVGG